MLIVDDILLFPFRSIIWIFKQIQKNAEEEIDNQAERITAELSELYMMLDTGRISEEEFETREKDLLDRLDEIDEYKRGGVEEEEAQDETV